ncbi:MAG: hypothetical protein JWO64_2393 [Hyphomicrobiales bacterium]|jgi:hypothetical protein|nr:hypothetical protein [Hyphomicrobiales bacterium]
MKLVSVALLGSSLLVCLAGTADAASRRAAPYPFRCDGALGSFIESARDCYYFTMREMYGDPGFVSPFSGYAPEGYADPRAWRFRRVSRIHHR